MGIFLLVFGIVLAIVAGACFYAAPKMDSSFGYRLGGALVALVAVVMLILSCVSKVDARSIGIETSAGKYVDTLHGGFHFTAPWASVEEWTTRNQTLRFQGTTDSGDKANYVTQPQIQVRLGNQSIAYVEATITWTVGEDETGIEGLWKQYKGFDDMRHDFVTPTVLGAVNVAFDGYDPFASISTNTVSTENGTAYVPLSTWSEKIAAALRPLFAARGLQLLNAQATQVHYDQRTEDKLRAYADAVANTRIAAQNAETAKKDAEATANRNNAKQIVPGCEALIRDLASSDQLKNLPAGWQCPGVTGPAVVGAR